MYPSESQSNFIRHTDCPECGSSDANSIYDDGHGYCFSCNNYTPGNETEVSTPPPPPSSLLPIEYIALSNRHIHEESCRKWGYGIGEFNGEVVQVATYKDRTGTPVAQKIRFKNKDFKVLGDIRKAGLWGESMWGGGKMLVVTEGEIDALSVSQINGLKWPVCSIPNGASGAARSVARSLPWLESFESVIFMFDNDEPGKKAARECAMLMSPGKAKIAQLPLKDANEMLQAGRGKEVIEATWGAKVFRPDGVVLGEELWGVVSTHDDVPSVPYPWGGLNGKTHGIRVGDLVTLTSGTGIGKTSVCREVAHSLITKGYTVGYIALEESVKRSALGLIGIELNQPVHINHEDVSEDSLREGFDATLGTGKVVFYDHFGSLDSQNLLSRIRYMVRAMDAQFIILDHLSIVISAYEEGDERRRIDSVMTKLRSLVEELDIALLLVSHLKRPEGKSHEEGGQTSLAQLRGSQAIAQLSDMVLGFERNQQDEDFGNVMTVRVLKNRYSGECGIATYLKYDTGTGRLSECNPDFVSPEKEEVPF